MRYKTILRTDLTYEKFGYGIEGLPPESHKNIIVECSHCHQIFQREFRYLTKLHQCSVIDGDKKRCYKCKLWKSFDNFPKRPSASGNVGKLCKECHNSQPSVKKYERIRSEKRKILFNTDISQYIKKRCWGLKKQAEYKQIPFNLTPKILFDLWSEQNGKCFYSNLPMISHGKDFGWQRWESPSVDRKDPDKGYVANNVVWCCSGINSFKGRLNDSQFEATIKTAKWWFDK